MSETVVALRGVSLTYSSDRVVHALRDVDLTLESQRSIAISGRSGSGKSSLIAVLSLLRRPTSGTVEILGEDTSVMSDTRLAQLRARTIGVVFQSFHLENSLTATENVILPWFIEDERTMTHRSAVARAADLFEQLEIPELAKRRPGSMSGGQRQRVAIARALFARPRILVADEPTGNLDEETANSVAEILVSLPERTGATVVIVTHDSTIARMVQQRAVLSHGRLSHDEHSEMAPA